jgi:hypothetical protein
MLINFTTIAKCFNFFNFDLGVFISNDLLPFSTFEKPYLPIPREKKVRIKKKIVRWLGQKAPLEAMDLLRLTLNLILFSP